MPPTPEDDLSTLEKARERLYQPPAPEKGRAGLAAPESRVLPHAWKDVFIPPTLVGGKRHVRIATLFFAASVLFFVLAAAVAGYIFFIGGNSVSVDKVSVEIQGPTTIAGGDTASFLLTITNRNAVAIQNASLEVTLPQGTRSASDVLQPYPRYTETIGTLESGASVTRTVRAVLFGGSGQTLAIPISLSYSAAGSNAVFVKKATHSLQVSTTPLSVSVDVPSEAVIGQPFTFSITVRSNATIPLQNVVLANMFPFGFTVNSTSMPLDNASVLLGTMTPGASRTITITGTLVGQEQEQKSFRFSVGTANTPQEQTLAVTYMAIDTPVTVSAPFITTTLSLNGDSSLGATVAAGARQSVTLTYSNKLPTSISNATISVAISGAINYESIQTTNGFYRSADHTIVFSRDTDPALGLLAPGASGIGTFSFTTLPAGSAGAAPSIVLTTSVEGTRVGQSNVPERVSVTAKKTIKVVTAVAFTASSLHYAGPFRGSGPIPPRANEATTYTIVWNVRNQGSAVAGATVKTILPSYVSYSNAVTNTSAFSYDEKSRTVTWNIGELAQGASTQEAFLISFTPSTSQRSSAPTLTGSASFSGYDRFAGVAVNASADPVTTETKGDPGYIPANAVVQ